METSEDIEGSLDDLLKQELTDYQGDFQKTCKFIKIFSESCIALTNNIYNRILHAIEDDGGLFFKDELIKIKPTEISVYNLLYLKETFYETEIIFELQVGEEYYKCRYYDDQSMTNFNNALKFKETPWKQIKIEIIEKLQSGEKMDFDINNLTDEEKQTIIEFIKKRLTL
jgi:hypothetical protein